MSTPIVSRKGIGWIPKGFKKVPGWPYAVGKRTNRVWSIPRWVIGGNGARQHFGGHFLRHGADGARLYVVLCVRGRRVWCVNIGALKLTTFINPCPDGMECCHNDGDHTNNWLSNLRWDTRSANQMDRVDHSTSNRGERCGAHKLTEDEVLEIFHMPGS